jgi:membrane protein implicated in regulation of membrane protease activity
LSGYSIKLLPFLAVAAALFGGVYFYIGINTMLLGAPGWGALIAIFGAMGVLLAVALWRMRKRLLRRASEDQPPNSGT